MTIETKSPEFRVLLDEVIAYASKRSKKWIDQDEVERDYSIKATQLWELRKENIIKSKKVGSKVLISVASLEKFLNS